MEQLHRSATISSDPHNHPALDFNALRDEGIGYLQQLAGNTWTDHNLHDPGITILDQLCYALTDLSYRISFNTRDLLARPNGETYNSLYSPAKVLSTNPVTLNDFRKVLLDIPGVKNAWIEKVERPAPEIYYDPASPTGPTLSLKDRDTLAADKPLPAREIINIRGLYRVFVTKTNPAVKPSDLRDAIWARLQNCRNLCEDFEEVNVLDEQDIIITGTVEVTHMEDVNKLAANVLYRAASWLSPSIKFYTLQQMQAKGKRIDEIIYGPTLQHGFIDDDELDSFNRLNHIFASDLIREMMAEPGVRVVTDIWMDSDVEPGNGWVLPLDNTRVPVLNVKDSLAKGLVFKKNGRELNLNHELVIAYVKELQYSAAAVLPAPDQLDIIPEKVNPQNLDSYYSIQNHFPLVYGITHAGLPDTVSEQRKAQAKQLKAYLLFFEQLLANYFAQAGNIKQLFSFHNTSSHTYFSQSLIGLVPDVDDLLKAKYIDELAQLTEEKEAALDRKNRFLDHLLGRFSENLVDYSLWLNDRQILKSVSERQSSIESEKERNIKYKNTLVAAKLNFLQNYPQLGSQRGKAYNQTLDGWENENVSGLEKRIAAKLGIVNYQRRWLADQEDGFHMVEHILLRPGRADQNAIDDYTATKNFSGFSKAKDGMMICECENHGLQNGDVILVNDDDKQTPYEVSLVFEHNFRIKADFDEHVNEERQKNGKEPLTWVRRDFNSTIFVFEKGIVVKDPYSFQLTFVFPSENTRLNNDNFKEFIETTIREETPAHLSVYIQWLSNDELRRFETAYYIFLNRLANHKKKLL